MNAYELAEQAEGLVYEIPADWSSGEPKNVATDIADMLRQQADRIAALELQLFKVTNRTIATRKKLSKLKKEKIRAYDNGYQDGQKSLQHQSEQIETLLSFLQYKGIAGQWIIYNANEMVRKANTQLHPESTK